MIHLAEMCVWDVCVTPHTWEFTSVPWQWTFSAELFIYGYHRDTAAGDCGLQTALFKCSSEDEVTLPGVCVHTGTNDTLETQLYLKDLAE